MGISFPFFYMLCKVTLAVFDMLCYNKMNYADNRTGSLPVLPSPHYH